MRCRSAAPEGAHIDSLQGAAIAGPRTSQHHGVRSARSGGLARRSSRLVAARAGAPAAARSARLPEDRPPPPLPQDAALRWGP